MESSKTFSQIHYRIPAVLENEQLTEVQLMYAVKRVYYKYIYIYWFLQDWLDSRRVSASRAVSMLRPIDNLTWYEVSSVVNNSRNKSEDCNKPVSKMYV